MIIRQQWGKSQNIHINCSLLCHQTQNFTLLAVFGCFQNIKSKGEGKIENDLSGMATGHQEEGWRCKILKGKSGGLPFHSHFHLSNTYTKIQLQIQIQKHVQIQTQIQKKIACLSKSNQKIPLAIYIQQPMPKTMHLNSQQLQQQCLQMRLLWWHLAASENHLRCMRVRIWCYPHITRCPKSQPTLVRSVLKLVLVRI